MQRPLWRGHDPRRERAQQPALQWPTQGSRGPISTARQAHACRYQQRCAGCDPKMHTKPAALTRADVCFDQCAAALHAGRVGAFKLSCHRGTPARGTARSAQSGYLRRFMGGAVQRASLDHSCSSHSSMARKPTRRPPGRPALTCTSHSRGSASSTDRQKQRLCRLARSRRYCGAPGCRCKGWNGRFKHIQPSGQCFPKATCAARQPHAARREQTRKPAASSDGPAVNQSSHLQHWLAVTAFTKLGVHAHVPPAA